MRGIGTKYKNHTYKTIVIPKILDLSENRSKVIKTILDIRDVILNSKKFVIDHRDMQFATKEALLLIVSEIERCISIKGHKLKAKYKLFPKNEEIQELLEKIGYWSYFNIKTKKHFNKQNSKLFLKIISDKKVSGEKIGNLIEFFEEMVFFDIQTRDKFADAMTEAAANTVEHAYSKKQDIETIDKWWLTASLNKQTNEISFVFYDQGLGILNTLESAQKSIKFKRLIAGWAEEKLSKGGILKRLLTTNLSQYKSDRRGNGLMSFKNFIDEVESGELTIYTDDVSYSAVSDNIVSYSDSIEGTLIVWKIQVNYDNNNTIYIKGE